MRSSARAAASRCERRPCVPAVIQKQVCLAHHGDQPFAAHDGDHPQPDSGGAPRFGVETHYGTHQRNHAGALAISPCPQCGAHIRARRPQRTRKYVSAGAGFIVVSLGAISFIPGLPIKPAYYKIDLDLSSSPPRVVGLS